MNAILILVPTHVSDHCNEIVTAQKTIRERFGSKYAIDNVDHLPITLVNTEVEQIDIDMIKQSVHEDVQIILIKDCNNVELKQFVQLYYK